MGTRYMKLMSDIIYKRITEADSKFSLFGNNEKILVALSGGADSVTLLLSLKEYFPSLSVYACHVNHMLRGAEANRDCSFAKKLCEQNNIPCEVLEFDVAGYAEKNNLSTELAARKIRYDFFEKVCRKHGIKLVATAHTLSDNAETVLFNLTRGTSLSGLCGIPPKRALSDDIYMVRPLIYASREEIEAYLEERKQSYVTDSTNLTDEYTRNYFRHKIIPALKHINPSFESILKNTCATLKDMQIFIKKTAENNMTDDIGKLSLMDDCLLSEIVIALYKQKTNSTLLESVHVSKIISLIKTYANKNFSGAKEICLPGKFSAIITDGKLDFVPTVRNKPVKEGASYCVELNPGVNVIPDTDFTVVLCKSGKDIPELSENFVLYDTASLIPCCISGKLVARNRRPQDKVKTCGMTKKLKELFIKNKIPAMQRNILPLICDEDSILYVPKTAIDDRHKAAQHTAGSETFRIFIYSGTPS